MPNIFVCVDAFNFKQYQYQAEDKVSCSRIQHSASNESRTSDPSISSITEHWATVVLMNNFKQYILS